MAASSTRPRLTRLVPARLSATQRALYRSLTRGPRRRHAHLFELVDADGALHGPFNAMLVNPRLGAVLDRLGTVLRYETSLPATVRETVILYVAWAWRSEYEWYAHSAVARHCGMPEHVLTALRDGHRPTDTAPDLLAAYDLCACLHRNRRVPDEVYWTAHAELGEQGLVELVALFGYYSMLAAALVAFETSLPENAAATWS